MKNFQTAFPYPKFVGRILVSDKISRIKLSDSRIRPTSAFLIGALSINRINRGKTVVQVV